MRAGRLDSTSTPWMLIARPSAQVPLEPDTEAQTANLRRTSALNPPKACE